MGVTADEEDDRRTCVEEGDDEAADGCVVILDHPKMHSSLIKALNKIYLQGSCK